MIRKATIEDAPRIAEIHIFGWRSAYRGILPDEYLFSGLSVCKRAISLEKAFMGNRDEVFVHDDGGILKGFMTVGMCRNEDKKGSFELYGLYIEPLFKRQGIGKELLSLFEAEARNRACTEAVLWVLKDNHDARAFYESMGYSPDGAELTLERFGRIEVRYNKPLK